MDEFGIEPAGGADPGRRRSRRDFLVRAGLMAGALVGLSGREAQADDKEKDREKGKEKGKLPPDTKLDKLGLDEKQIKILTPRVRELTKKDLLRLDEINRTHAGKAKEEKILEEFNSYLKKEGRKELTVKDLDSLTKATKGLKKRVTADEVSCCCCTPCCCCSASAMTQPLVA